MGNLKKVTVIAFLVTFVLGAVLSTNIAGCKNDDRRSSVTNGGIVTGVAIPAIDSSKPLKTETATFALG